MKAAACSVGPDIGPLGAAGRTAPPPVKLKPRAEAHVGREEGRRPKLWASCWKRCRPSAAAPPGGH
eukprot:9968408-Alexandrium_andersonii.AAC.1